MRVRWRRLAALLVIGVVMTILAAHSGELRQLVAAVRQSFEPGASPESRLYALLLYGLTLVAGLGALRLLLSHERNQP